METIPAGGETWVKHACPNLLGLDSGGDDDDKKDKAASLGDGFSYPVRLGKRQRCEYQCEVRLFRDSNGSIL
ncbi:hypothetical protein GCM10007898_11030 [Dyella flagellata]|uniref:Uncharacterized protein n=1 Tax=Dyella flagellata TaxID=1867833 RepID=A0ABQ5X8F5_9GAMM|nr:hypothetical protein GCM10007898_11030 [Dyella flagellata]